MAVVSGRVDPRPVRPPLLGLLASCNNVVVGADAELVENAYVGPFNANNASGPGEPSPLPFPRTKDEQPDIDAAAYAAGFIDGEGHAIAADWERPQIGHPVRWINGFSYRPESCDGSDRIAVDGTTEGTPPALENQINVRPFLVEGIDRRSTFGNPTDDVYDECRQWARRQLLACESKQLEEELWKGTLTQAQTLGNRYLADANCDLPVGDQLIGYITALGVLERGIGEGSCSQQGMIHARQDIISIWDKAGALRRVGNLLLTIHDSIVVPGRGYDGSAPIGATGEDPAHFGKLYQTDSSWVYATTVVDARRGAFISSQPIQERLNQGSNQLTTYERRPAAVTWGCLQIGVHVDHTTEITVTHS